MGSTIPVLSQNKAGQRRNLSVDNFILDIIPNGSLKEFIKTNMIKAILPYDSYVELEAFCQENGVTYLSSTESVKESLRDKTNIDTISRAINLDPISGVTGTVDDFDFETLAEQLNLPLFMHFAEGAGGSGNYIVNNKDEFMAVKQKQRGKRLNVKKFITGRSSSIDICVMRTSIACGHLEEMVIGSAPLADNPTQYVASSWFENGYGLNIRKRIMEICVRLGEHLRNQGFLGIFHPDFLITGDKIYLTELNMRFGGSCGIYQMVQNIAGQIPLLTMQALTFTKPDIVIDTEKINLSNLQPQSYAMMVIKNNKKEQVRINPYFLQGCYSFTNGVLSYKHKKTLKDLNQDDELLIYDLPDNGSETLVDPGSYICTIVTRFPISDGYSNLNEVGRSLGELVFDTMTS